MKDIALLMVLNQPAWALPVKSRSLWARIAAQNLCLPEPYDERVWFAEMDKLLSLSLVQKMPSNAVYRMTPEGLEYLRSMKQAVNYLGQVGKEEFR